MKLAIVHSTGHVWFGVTSLTRLVQISISPQSSAAMKIKYGALVGQNYACYAGNWAQSCLAHPRFSFSHWLFSVFSPFWLAVAIDYVVIFVVGLGVAFSRAYTRSRVNTLSSHWLSSIFSFFGFAVMITRSFASAFRWSVRSLWFARMSASNMCLQ